MPPSIDFAGLKRLLDQGAQLVEVLPAAEYAEERLPNGDASRRRNRVRGERDGALPEHRSLQHSPAQRLARPQAA